MSQPFKIMRSADQLPHKRVRHMAVTWKNTTIVYGGFALEEPRIDQLSVLFIHKSGKWTKKNTYGDFPTWSQLSGAHVVNDRMFVFDDDQNKMVVYSLDLHTWTWEMRSPNGTLPFGKGSALSSWVYAGKIYCFGGYKHSEGASNQLFCYNISTNSWEWPYTRGNKPSPRLQSSSIISEETVLVYGGISHENIVHNDLFTLDIVNMVWKRVHVNLEIGEGPSKFRNITLTKISTSVALLMGDQKIKNNSWILNLDGAKQLMAPSSIWTKVPNPAPRHCHAAVLQPLSKALWVIGGHYVESPYFSCLAVGSYTSDILKFKFSNLRPLKDLQGVPKLVSQL